jgi:hypothetical protein
VFVEVGPAGDLLGDPLGRDQLGRAMEGVGVGQVGVDLPAEAEPAELVVCALDGGRFALLFALGLRLWRSSPAPVPAPTSATDGRAADKEPDQPQQDRYHQHDPEQMDGEPEAAEDRKNQYQSK